MKKLLLFLGICVLLFSVTLFFLPSLLSTSFGKKIIEKMFLDGESTLSFQKIDLSWNGPQKVEKIQYHSNDFYAYIENFESYSNLWNWLKIKKLTLSSLIKLQARSLIKNAEVRINVLDSLASLKNIHGAIETENKDKPLKISFKGDIVSSTDMGMFDFSSQIFEEKYFGNFQLKNFPTVLLDELFFRLKKINKKFLTQMLGPKTTMNGNFKLEDFIGPLNVNLSSTNISTFISCELFKDKICLNNDLSLSLKLTDDLCQDLAKNRTPLFISGIKAYNPIFVNLASEGFYLPIPFDLKALVVPKGTLDMGKILVKNSENISLIIGLMKYHSFLEMEEMNVWCAPVDFRIEDGILYTSRMDLLLADSLHICSFGSIDLTSHKVDMLLGITADALEKSFRLSGLSEDYVMEIPLKGNTNKLKIDKKFALSKIAELLAPQRGENRLSFKDLFKMFKPESKKIPPPKRPYPWER